MLEEIRRVKRTADRLFDEEQVEAALDAMADKIDAALKDTVPLLLCVMNGGIVVAGKLLPRLGFPLTIDAINASRYQNRISGSVIEWVLKPAAPLDGRTVLIIDDILDEGITLKAIVDYCLAQGAAAVYTAVLIDKVLDHEKPVKADFIGLTTPNRYLFGYGMDYKGYWRNASGIFALKED